MQSSQKHVFTSHDDTQLAYQHWPAATEKVTKKAIILFHRGHEHSGRMAHLVNELNLPEFDFFAWDARGHGDSPGLRGDAPSFSACVKDIQSFVQHIESTYNIVSTNIAVIGQSVGAVLAATWVHDYAPKIRALCLASPAFDIKLYVPFAKAGLTVLSKLKGNFFITSYVKANMLTHDVDRAKTYDTDPQIAKAISVRMLLGLYAASERIVNDAQNIFVPTQVLCSGSDFVVFRKPQQKFYEKLPHPRKEFHVLDGFYHDTLGEKDRHIAIEKIRRFILQSFAEDYQAPDVLNADKIGTSCATAEQLSSPLPASSIKNLFWNLTKRNLKLGSKFSHGLKIGEDTGYDSGSTLDVDSGSTLIQQRNLENIAQFELGDAFDTASLAKVKPKPNLVIVSGLYELFSDNDLLRQSLSGIHQAMLQGGFLIYTGQIWHPQQEFIARALTSHRQGDAWVMRLRSQAEMDALVEQAGFKKVDQCIDEFGIFTVSVAQRV